MSKSLYLINPKADAPSYYEAEIFAHLGLPPTALIADLAITTVAALAPADFEITLCDEHVSAVDLDHPADFIGITGKSSQVGRMLALAQEFRQRGKIVLIGGPFASLSPHAVRPYCDILIQGEMEEIAPHLFAELASGQWQPEYTGGRPDLRLSPLPRWDLYPNDRAFFGCVQTSRGCPFECEFCDVIQYAGRKQRHKAVEQVLAEVEQLYQLGYRSIFLADDNFTVYRRRAKELLIALRDWNNHRTEGRVTFSTQVSIDTAREEELLQLCAAAGITEVFIGIETPNEESLRETGKRQNIGIDLLTEIQRFVEYGISIVGGMIVGFDADGPDIFQRQYDFAMRSPIAVFTLGALVAPDATPLHARLHAANRLGTQNATGSTMTPWQTNILPAGMSQETLYAGLRWLANKLYAPEAFGDRLVHLIETFGQKSTSMPPQKRMVRNVDLNAFQVVRKIADLGEAEARMFRRVTSTVAQKPAAQGVAMSMLFRYMQLRYMYERGQFWEPRLAEQPALVVNGIDPTAISVVSVAG